MILSMNTKDIIKDLKILEDNFDFKSLDENHELFSEKNKKMIGEYKIETLRKIWMDEFACLRSNAYSFLCKIEDKNKNKKMEFLDPNRNISNLKNMKSLCIDGV